MRSVLLIDEHRDRRHRLASALLDRGCAVRAFGADLVPSDLTAIPYDVVIINLADFLQGEHHVLGQILAHARSRMTIAIVQESDPVSNQHVLDQGVILVTAIADVENRICSLIAPEGAIPHVLTPAHSPSRTIASSLRQKAIIAGVMEGHSNKRIADEVGISEQSVKNKLTSLYRTYQVRNRVSLINALLKRSGQP